MSRWEPHIDLMRLLEALGNEIVTATELEVRQACAECGSTMAGTAKLMWSAWSELQVEGGSPMASTAEEVREVRELIDAAIGEPGEPEVDVEKGHIELGTSRHLQSVADRGSRTCYKQPCHKQH
jgi:hypothetical protein